MILNFLDSFKAVYGRYLYNLLSSPTISKDMLYFFILLIIAWAKWDSYFGSTCPNNFIALITCFLSKRGYFFCSGTPNSGSLSGSLGNLDSSNWSNS